MFHILCCKVIRRKFNISNVGNRTHRNFSIFIQLAFWMFVDGDDCIDADDEEAVEAWQGPGIADDGGQDFRRHFSHFIIFQQTD